MNYMQLIKLVLLVLVMLAVAGCQYVPRLDEVIPDRRTEYRQSRAMAELEVPPDLTAEQVGGGMRIPGEEATTLSAFEQQQRGLTGAAAYSSPDEQWVTVRGSRFDIWPRLQEYWQERGISLDLDDAELGVLETAWSQPRQAEDSLVRDKFKIFTEPGSEDGTTLLFITHVMQRQAALGAGETQWVDASGSKDMETRIAGDMSEFFGGSASRTEMAATGTGAGTQRRSGIARAEIVNHEDGHFYLSLPNAYDEAWQLTERALVRSGMNIRSADAAQGEYQVLYTPPAEERQRGWFSRMAFWRSDEPEERPYRVRLTGVDNRTELVLLDADGVRRSDDEARTVLTMIQRQYAQ